LGRPGRRVVMQAGTLDTRAITLGGRVIQGEQPARTGIDGAAEIGEERGSAPAGLAVAEGTEHGIGAAELVADAAGPEPGGGRTAALGQEFAQEERLDEFSMAWVEERGYLG